MEKSYDIACWAIVDFMGHVRLAGYCETVLLGGKVPALLVEVPEGPHGPAFSCIRGLESIYNFLPATESAARATLAAHAYELREFYALLQLDAPDTGTLRYLSAAANDVERDDVDDEERDDVSDDEDAYDEDADGMDEPPF